MSVLTWEMRWFDEKSACAGCRTEDYDFTMNGWIIADPHSALCLRTRKSPPRRNQADGVRLDRKNLRRKDGKRNKHSQRKWRLIAKESPKRWEFLLEVRKTNAF
ncbi:hypothetical protein WR25_18080 [Diploscapter pachys]|uniref:Uncharacterized protein n=1 Tax=Diploscapter pachys TaxID=2018661 RepID=A0A2A2LKC6_9BILA|nr:hypothetical protein WR25_18080 [Diploscapter pachys]